jgi:RNA polymerase-associated protein RTF1
MVKIDDINALVNRSWTEAELQEKLNKSGALKNRYTPIERNRLNNLMKEAKQSQDFERLEELKIELEALDGPKLAFGTSMRISPKKASKEPSQQDRLAMLNKENRRKNAEEVRQAQIRERRAVRATEAALARGESVVEDHSRRVKTRAKFKHDVADVGKKLGTGSGTSTPTAADTPIAANSDGAPHPHMALLQQQVEGDKKGIPTIRRALCDADIIGAIDLGIEIEI